MLISYNWQRELTGTTLDPQEMRERLTNVGLAVDAVEARDGDHVLDVEVPSNRGDCLSHVGIARELAVIEKSQISDLRSQISNLRSPVLKLKSARPKERSAPLPRSKSLIPISAQDMPPESFAG